MHAISQKSAPFKRRSHPATVRSVFSLALMFLCFALAIAAVIGVRFVAFEYFHGDADAIQHLAGSLFR